MSFFHKTLDAYTDSLAAYMPGGPLFMAKNIQDSNFRKLLRGLSGELFRAGGILEDFSTIPDQSLSFIEEWESALGIPDDCFTELGDIDSRRRNILVKLASLGVSTQDDFIQLAAVFGREVWVRPAYANEFSGVSAEGHRYIIVVEGENLTSGSLPYSVPFPLYSNESLLNCIFQRVKPACCILIMKSI